jgi:hypothetical protein
LLLPILPSFLRLALRIHKLRLRKNAMAEAAGVYPKQPQFFFVSANFSLNWHAFPLLARCLS